MKSAVAKLLGQQPSGSPIPEGGGCIHNTHRWGDYFIKSNAAHHARGFRCEATGLRAIAETGSIRTPEVIATGSHDGTAVLILEYLDLCSSGNEEQLGENLARLHLSTASSFGFAEDNFIGTTPQPNPTTASWREFFTNQRLRPMFTQLSAKGISFPESESLLERIDDLVPEQLAPSLLHGDLWSGNRGFLPDGSPVLFDPACYYGHAACDLAMTRLFGGFGPTFYEAYHSKSLEPDDPVLAEFYNLYHLLNHALLFGGSYINQAHDVIRKFS